MQRPHAGGAQVLVQHANGIAADDVTRPGDRIGRDRHAARQRFELHDAERVGPARKHEHVGAGEIGRQHLLVQQAQELGGGKTAAQLGLLRALPMTTFDPGRSSERKASRFFSTAIRPTQMKIGRGRPRSMARSGRNSSVSTPRVRMPSCSNPRALNSAISEGVEIIVTVAAAWKRRRAA